MAELIADEIHLASEKHGRSVANTAAKSASARGVEANYTAAMNEAADVYRERIFNTMTFEDADGLRKSPGRFAATYLREIRRRPNETERQFYQRVNTAQRTARRGRGVG